MTTENRRTKLQQILDARRVANTVSDSTSGGDILRRLAAELEKPSTQKTALSGHWPTGPGDWTGA